MFLAKGFCFQRRVCSHVFVVACLASANGLAQPADWQEYYGDEDMISIATGRPQPIAKAPAVVSIVSADDIAASGANSWEELLVLVPGLHIAQGTVRSNALVFRGLSSETNTQALVLLNGTPLRGPILGNRGAFLDWVPIANIERIEVIRGPGSALYGADAFAGVIDIQTKQAQHIDGVQVGARTGSFDTNMGWALYGQQFEQSDLAVVLQYHASDGHDPVIQHDSQTSSDALLGTDFSLAPGAANYGGETLDLGLDWGFGGWRWRTQWTDRRDLGPGLGYAEVLDQYGRYGSRRLLSDLSYVNDHLSDDWVLDGKLSYLDMSQSVERDVLLRPKGFFIPLFSEAFEDGVIGNSEYDERVVRLAMSASYTGIDDHRLHFGSGYVFEDLYQTEEAKNFDTTVFNDPASGGLLLLISPKVGGLTDVSDTDEVYVPEGDRESFFFFLQDEWSFSADWQLIAGLRTIVTPILVKPSTRVLLWSGIQHLS